MEEKKINKSQPSSRSSQLSPLTFPLHRFPKYRDFLEERFHGCERITIIFPHHRLILVSSSTRSQLSLPSHSSYSDSPNLNLFLHTSVTILEGFQHNILSLTSMDSHISPFSRKSHNFAPLTFPLHHLAFGSTHTVIHLWKITWQDHKIKYSRTFHGFSFLLSRLSSSHSSAVLPHSPRSMELANRCGRGRGERGR